jgi:hypothetical protein
VKVSAHGLTIDVLPGWDARIRLLTSAVEATVNNVLGGLAGGPQAHPVLHAGDFALPEHRGDFGSGAVDIMRPTETFIALVEYRPDNTKTALFAHAGPPRQISPDAFSTQQLQRTIRGQAGVQRFFSDQGRAFCLYVVIGSMANRRALAAKVNATLARIEIGTA